MRLALDLSHQQDAIPVSQLRYISTRMAEAYAKKTDKTIQRDVNELEKLKIIKRTEKGIRANRELIVAFLSPTI
jgi:DeoR/GlpR family transcriptional regulator of sugar metabolism